MTDALGRSALIATIRTSRDIIQNCHYFPPFQRIAWCLRRTALTLRQEGWAKYPARVDFWSRFRGVFPGHRVVAIAAKRVTSTQAPQDQGGAFEGAVLFQRLKRIGRAGRLIPAIKSHPGAKK